MKFKILVVLFAAATLISGCEEKKETSGDSGDKDKKEAKKDDAKKDDAKKDDKGGGLPQACEDYLKANADCMKNLPAAAKPAMETADKAQRDAFKSASTPEAKKALEPTCKQLLEALKTNPSCK